MKGRGKFESAESIGDAFKTRRYRCLLFATRVARALASSTDRLRTPIDGQTDRPNKRAIATDRLYTVTDEIHR